MAMEEKFMVGTGWWRRAVPPRHAGDKEWKPHAAGARQKRESPHVAGLLQDAPSLRMVFQGPNGADLGVLQRFFPADSLSRLWIR